MRLHNLLMTHQSAIPELLEKALNLTKIVASEEHSVYAEFLGHEDDTYRLVAYLEKVREASLVSLERGGGVS
jgi:nuclear pore complex protein Nup107